MNLLKIILEDQKINKDIKIRFSLFIFRIGNFFWFQSNLFYKILYYIVKLFYKLVVEYLLSIELPLNSKVGIGLKIEHGYGLVVNYKSIIGDRVTLKHNTTIGCKTNSENRCIKYAIIGNDVIIHPHSCIIGVSIGNNAIIGAGSIVVKNVEANSIVAGNPAKLIKTNK
ncbi:hypothetical protein QWY87_13820 [Lutimonas halocynthiae]|uniref:hypothetical protein n=1 Tax=Lutimonas halocynthiae TaxID=1446477 RepID=UPI0025B3A393|nr:hypothetical protein [Lutimonas halocynthiae]MDN3643790.1 hypothetical protein [Lutimonas halocynthiae]